MLPPSLLKRLPGSLARPTHRPVRALAPAARSVATFSLRGPSVAASTAASSAAASLSHPASSSRPHVPSTLRRTLHPHSNHRLYATLGNTMPSSSPYSRDYGNFKLLQSFELDYAPVTISKWRSEKTGLTVTLGNHSSPITNGYFVVASEIFDDTGRPHTLEHLVFLGSKSYPYKGVLDQLANRAGSNGTNAWTANDHTAYTISTAGSQGFLEMLPVYVDHILHPTMSDAGFVTEVHHINGEGEDAGVVYSEMQARENQSGDRMALEMQRTVYPPSSAYRSETGGLLKALRVLTAAQIREYHGTYYVPHNLCLHMDGAVDVPALFDVLNNKVEPLILAEKKDPQIPPAGWKRPFVETTTATTPAFTKAETKVVEFMEEDESMGEVMSLWVGPNPNDFLGTTALDTLNTYLTYSATSPLQKEFIEIPEPLTTHIGIYIDGRVNHSELLLYSSDVPKKHLNEIVDLIKAKLKKIVQDKDMDMDRMKSILRRGKRKLLNRMEASVTSAIADNVILDFLYGQYDGGDLPEAFEELKDYVKLESWTADQWLALLDKYYISAPSVTTIGKPSASLAQELEKVEKARIAKQKEDLGEDGLKKLQKELDQAKAESEKPIPSEMLTSFPVTNPADLTWVPVETAINQVPGDKIKSDNGAVQRHIEADALPVPLQTHFSHVKSNFVTVTVLLDAAKVPSHLMPYLSIFQASLFSLGVTRPDGTTLTHEEVVNQLNDFTVETHSQFAFRRCFSESFIVWIKAQNDQYGEAVSWLRDVLAGSNFTKERLEVIVAKELQNLPAQKREGDVVARSWANRLTYDVSKSPSEASSLLTLLEFIPQISEELKTEPEKVIKALEELRSHLLNSETMRISVAGDILSISEPRTTLVKNFIPIKEAVPLKPLSTSRESLSALGENPSKKMVVIPMSAIEGSYSYHYAKGVVGWDHPDLPALILANNVLNTMESYLWKSIRGAGLAYGANVEVDSESGICGFSVYRSPNAEIAYREAGKILRQLADGAIELDANIVDGSRASLTYAYARKSETVGAAASSAYLDEVLKGVGKNHSQEMLAKLPLVTLDQIREVIRKYFVPVFDPATAIGAVSVNSGKADEVEAGFKELGFEVERKELPTLGADDEGSGSETGSESGSETGSGSGSSVGEPMDDVRSP